MSLEFKRILVIIEKVVLTKRVFFRKVRTLPGQDMAYICWQKISDSIFVITDKAVYTVKFVQCFHKTKHKKYEIH